MELLFPLERLQEFCADERQVKDVEIVTKILEEVIETICDKHCKFPSEYYSKYKDEQEAEEHLYTEKCDNCVLNKL